jgi:hypothetical protein
MIHFAARKITGIEVADLVRYPSRGNDYAEQLTTDFLRQYSHLILPGSHLHVTTECHDITKATHRCSIDGALVYGMEEDGVAALIEECIAARIFFACSESQASDCCDIVIAISVCDCDHEGIPDSEIGSVNDDWN